ncbi:MAG: hypothetical protein KDC84_02250 [Crocinitomicaceae bacterium]|nr:hypothetical protein [Crocinitomicaceae bacterium]
MNEVIELFSAFGATVLIIIAQSTYIYNIFKRKIRPSTLSWIGWFLLMFATLIAIIVESGWEWSMSGFAISTFGCGFIGLSALLLKQYTYRSRDWFYFVLGLGCGLIYQISKDPMLTTIAGILADFIIGIPTIVKVITHPDTERTKAWSFGLTSWTLSTLAALQHDLLYILFPAYLMLFNATMIIFTNRKKPDSNSKNTLYRSHI